MKYFDFHYMIKASLIARFGVKMKITDVPQQSDDIYEGLKKVVYAADQNGTLNITQSAGWDAEIDVLKDAVEEIDRLTAEALQRAHQQKTSPLEYYMYLHRLDLAMFAQVMGKFQWQIRRHFKPKNFAKLSSKQLESYALALGIDCQELQQLPKD